MNDLEAVLELIAMAMLQALEHAKYSGESVVVSFVVEGNSARIAPVLRPSGYVYTGHIIPEGMVGEFKP